MHTFLPFPDFQQSAAVLDRARLGKQRVEALQILRALVIPEYGWQSHPAVRMWMGYVPALTKYGLAMVDEWTARGGEDTTREKIMEFAPQAAHPGYAGKIPMPPWLGEPDFHLSHQSRLVAKDPKFYAAVFPDTAPDLEYVWPEPKHELLPEDPAGDRMWVLRLPLGDTEAEQLSTVSLPPAGRAKGGASAPGEDDYQFVYAESGSRRPTVRKLPPKQLPKKPTRKRRQQEEAFATLPGKSVVAIPLNGGSSFAIGKVLGRPITVDGQFARNFEIDEIVDRAAFDYPALLQDPRAFFPIPAR
ncbi:MSMEG_6728 family protein [Arthrobacter sp. PM3]|uniref:MSMEG_6728 family protein n=1 Tax=Arthrobacter sp. PM3 TaxID=2017685 RepID=UPI000E10A1B5|nr:MSMEG_6728 family protein [Arthrobacter sp. PM3]AXJ10169.1 hypothetical protein CFN17_11460 [Arthrobacter sp. PM3]